LKRADMGTAIGLMVLSTWLFWYVGRYQVKEIYGYGPDFFPRLLGVLMFLLAVGLIINALRGNSMKMAERIDPRGFRRMLTSIGICIGYLFLMQILGFAASTFVFLFVLMTLIRQKGLTVRILGSLATALVVWGIFRYFLVIPLPEGWLF
jgi:putative tricarboxylic transport membrane protein